MMRLSSRFLLTLVVVLFGSLPLAAHAQNNEDTACVSLADHVVFSRVQANMPTLLPESAPYFVQVGDVELEDAVLPNEALTPVDPVRVMTLMAANLRMGPSVYAPSVATVPFGTRLLADAMSESSWLRVVYEGMPAWISYATLEANPAIDRLPRLSDHVRTPMQDFYLNTGNEEFCAVPSLLIVQAVENTFVDITANGANIEAQTTIALRIDHESRKMQLIVLEGAAWLDNFEGAIIEGCVVSVRLREDGQHVMGSWGDLHPLTQDDVATFRRLNAIPTEALDHAIPMLGLSSWISPDCTSGNPFGNQIAHAGGAEIDTPGEASDSTASGGTGAGGTQTTVESNGTVMGVALISPTGNGAPAPLPENNENGTGTSDNTQTPPDGGGGGQSTGGGTGGDSGGGSGGGNGGATVADAESPPNLEQVPIDLTSPPPVQVITCDTCQAQTFQTQGVNLNMAPQTDGPPIGCTDPNDCDVADAPPQLPNPIGIKINPTLGNMNMGLPNDDHLVPQFPP